ncbi:M48 family metallopeptidase [Paludibacter sp.]|uniref:M48 family metallopeptidase n=1 Tax=Paludibacter sp. TaxID=1898105 RepID=UPI0013551AF2|nr:M48 family metallopeptidase [Paludibacter sp.]MTK53111.1 M48 family metalloprotease [Paludibacter sp.]
MLNYQDFIHPEDEAARRNMEAVPGFSAAVKAFLKTGLEQYMYGVNMASKIRLSEKQLPELYQKLPPICRKMGVEEPEFYLEMNPAPNAYTFGDTRIFLTITSGLVEYLDDDELEAVIAHECGHIVCRHVLYHTMANMLKAGADMFGLLGMFTTPVQLALYYWSRKSELSADRAAAIVSGSPKPVVETMIRLSGGPKSITEKVDIEEYAAQAEAYDALQEKTWDKALQTYAVAFLDHPFSSVRTREILKWCETEQFSILMNNITLQESGTVCSTCYKPIEKDWKFCKYCGMKLENIN